jgi:hypothetical protein
VANVPVGAAVIGFNDLPAAAHAAAATIDFTGVTHGKDLVPPGSARVNVGPTALLGASGYPGSLQVVPVPSRGYWLTDTPDEFSLKTPYTYNNDPSNRGGVVPAGGMTIDGYDIPPGTIVVQFRDFSAGDFWCVSKTSFMWRGCRFRSRRKAPGYFNCGAGNRGVMFFFFNDMGGLGAENAQYNEVPIKITNASGAICYRNYITYTTTGIQLNLGMGAEIIENYISKLTYYYGPAAPPSEPTDKHLNGIMFNGGESCALVLRNNITGPNPDDAGRRINQTDCIGFFQDFGSFNGTGTNRDGTVGYQVRDNFIGGTGYCIYAGLNADKPSTSVKNMVLTGNQITTQWYPRGGNFGPIAAEPPWGINGNLKSNNVFVPSGAAW